MARKKLHNLMPDTGELPPGVPSVDEAWAAMRNKLTEQMPDKTGPVVIEGNAKAWRKYGFFLLLLIFATTWILMSTADNDSKKPDELSKSESQSKAIQDSQSELQPSSPAKTITDTPGAIPTNENSTKTAQQNEQKSEAGGNAILSEQTIKTKSAITGKKSSTNFDRNISARNRGKKSNLRQANSRGKRNVIKNEMQMLSVVGTVSEPDFNLKSEPAIDGSQSNVDSIDLSKLLAMPLGNATDSSATADAPKGLEGWQLKVGLQWTVQIPTYSASDYFTGPNANTQFYQILLPGIWFRMKTEKSALTAEVNPFYTNLVPSKSFGTFTSVENITDTVIITTEQKSMRKSFGVSTTLSYDYNVGERWWIGGGLQAYFLNKAIARVDVEEERRAINGSGKTVNTYSQTYAMPENEWAYFTKSHIGISGQVLYDDKRWQAGLRFILPVIPLAKQEGPKNPLRGEFIFRVPVFKKSK